MKKFASPKARVKEEFYKHAIASALFPGSFLHFFRAVSAGKRKPELYSKRVKLSPEYEAFVKNFYERESSGAGWIHSQRALSAEFKEAAKKFLEAGVVPNLNPANVDFPSGRPGEPFFFEVSDIDAGKLRDFLKRVNHPKSREVLSLLSRLQELRGTDSKEKEDLGPLFRSRRQPSPRE
ncbi:MAG: hypothetical protein ACPLZY_03175 [Candidatus Norongarragalinales archaeon]